MFSALLVDEHCVLVCCYSKVKITKIEGWVQLEDGKANWVSAKCTKSFSCLFLAITHLRSGKKLPHR